MRAVLRCPPELAVCVQYTAQHNTVTAVYNFNFLIYISLQNNFANSSHINF